MAGVPDLGAAARKVADVVSGATQLADVGGVLTAVLGALEVPARAWPRRDVTGCGKLCRGRSRLCRNEILQVNMRLKALVEIYTMHSFAQLQNHIFSKN